MKATHSVRDMEIFVKLMLTWRRKNFRPYIMCIISNQKWFARSKIYVKNIYSYFVVIEILFLLYLQVWNSVDGLAVVKQYNMVRSRIIWMEHTPHRV